MSSTDDPVSRARSLLTNARLCPGCRAPLAGPVCLRCGLDLRGERGAELWRASLAAAAALDARQDRLAALYRATPRAPVRAPAVDPRRAGHTFSDPGPAGPAATGARVALPMVPAPGVPAPGAPAGPHRPWTVQTVLQMLGAGLLAAACVVFLVVAWGSLPLAVRAVVIVLATVLVFGLASLLRRRDLPQGAEAVAALAVVLLLLDAWAARSTGLLDLGPAWAYWVLAFLACAAVLAAWGRRSRLATGRVAAAVLWLAAPVPLAAWSPEPATGAWVSLLVTAVAAVRFRPGSAAGDGPARRPEALVLACGGAIGAATGGGWALVLTATGRSGWAPAGQLAVLAAAAVATALLARRSAPGGWDRPTAPGWAVAAGVATGAGAAAAAVQAVGERDDGVMALAAATGAAALVATLVGAWRAADETTDRFVAGALGTAGALVGATTLAVVVLVAETLAGTTAASGRLAAATGAVAVGGLAAAVTGARRARLDATRLGVALTVTALVALALAAAAPGPRPWLPVATLLAVAGAGLAADLLLSRRAGHEAASQWRSWHDGARGGSLAAAALALGAAVPGRAASGVALLGLATLALRGRAWHRDAAALTTCVGVLLAGGGAGLLLTATGLDDVSATCVAAAAAAFTLGAVTFVAPRTRRDERAGAFGCAVAAAAFGWLIGVSAGVGATAVAVGVALLLLAATSWRGAVRVAPAAATQAVAVAAPVVALVAPTLRTTVGAVVALPGAVLLAAVLGAAAALLAPWVAERTAPESRAAARGGGAVTLAGAFAAAWLVGPDLAALVLLIAAVAALGVARTPDRAGLLWVALGLGAAASWVLLGARDVASPEAYLAPTGALLTALGARRARRGADGGLGLLGAGLALVLLPPALLPGDIPLGDLHLGRLAVTCAAAALLAGSALAVAVRRDRAGGRWQPVWLVAAVAAGLAVLGPFRNAVTLALGRPAAAPEPWALVAVVVLLAAAAVVPLGPRPEPALWWPACLAPALAAAVVPSLLAVAPGGVGWVRVLMVFGATGTAAVAAQRALLAAAAVRRGLRPAAVIAGTLAASAALLATARLHDVPGDVPLVVLGVLASALGVQWLLARPQGGTWPALAAGSAGVLVVPTLVSLGDGAGWRPLYLVVAGVAAVAAGAVLRWQAPFLVGSAVLLVVVASYLGPWAGTVLAATGSWPFLAAGGATLLGLGISYERRLAQAREAARFVVAMR